MIFKDLFDVVLLEPAKTGCDTLLVVSGYASAAMVVRHLEKLDSVNNKVRLQLIVGMCPTDGITQNNHTAFQQLVSDDYATRFECKYVSNSKPVHSKTYIWLKDSTAEQAFNGSANYTQAAFFERQREVMSKSDPMNSFNYYKSVLKDSIDCRDKDVLKTIPIRDDSDIVRRILHPELAIEKIDYDTNKTNLQSVKVSLLGRGGKVQNVGGLNWGAGRTKIKRNPNEAYIQLPPAVYKSTFFPERGTHFTVLTDDEKAFVCSRGQKDYGDAICTPQKNSLLGSYFRARLGFADGRIITKEDLDKYGRTDVDFYKIDDYTYLMDFSVS